MRGDVARPLKGESWQPLRFDHNPNDYSSFLTNAGQHCMLRVQRRDQAWTQLLLPDIYHTSVLTDHQQYGGLTGELPIFLALMAFSTSREYLPNLLPYMFQGGAWVPHVPHQYKQPRTSSCCCVVRSCADWYIGTDHRGVVVTVFTCPGNWHGGSTAHDLDQYERGNLGKYFN
jgi:hypothetical protein